MPEETVAQSNTEEPKGVGGWLLLFCFGAVMLGPLRTADSLAKLWNNLGPHPFPVQRQIAVISTVCTLAVMLYGIVVGILLLKKYRRGRAIARQYLLIRIVVVLLLSLIAISWAYNGFAATAAKRMAIAVIPLTILEMAVCLVWFLYFTYSKRVRNTYCVQEQ